MCMHGYYVLITSTDKQCLLTFSGLLLHGMQELGGACGVWIISIELVPSFFIQSAS